MDWSFSLLPPNRTSRRVSAPAAVNWVRLRLLELVTPLELSEGGPRRETLLVKLPSARRPMLSFDEADDTESKHVSCVFNTRALHAIATYRDRIDVLAAAAAAAGADDGDA